MCALLEVGFPRCLLMSAFLIRIVCNFRYCYVNVQAKFVRKVCVRNYEYIFLGCVCIFQNTFPGKLLIVLHTKQKLSSTNLASHERLLNQRDSISRNPRAKRISNLKIAYRKRPFVMNFAGFFVCSIITLHTLQASLKL